MDWEEEYRSGNDRDRAEDLRPRTQEELRARNARREKPVLDQQQRRERPRRKPASGQGGSPSGKRTAARNTGKSTQPVRRTRKQKRKAAAPETEVHWTDPKPFIRRDFTLKLVATLAVVLAVALGFSIFFKVGKISVSGTEKYTAEAVVDAAGIEKGESLLTLGKAKKAGNILAALPYVKEVQIGIKLPDTVNINIVELAVTYAIQDTEGRWWLMDSGGKLVEGVSGAEAAEHTKITGLVIQSPQVGSVIEAMPEQLPAETVPDATEGETVPEEPSPAEEPSEEEPSEEEPSQETEPSESLPPVTSPDTMTGSGVSKVEAVTEILRALESNNLMGEIREVDVTYLFNITLWYEDRFEVRLGDPVDLSYKVNYMAQAVEQLADYQIGVLDVTFSGEREVRFIPAEVSGEEES